MFISGAEIIKSYREQICEELFRTIQNFPTTSYVNFFLHDLGRERINQVLDLMLEALEGRPESFYADQAETSRTRASQGFRFEDTIGPIRVAKEFIINFVNKKNDEALLILDAKKELLKLYDIYYQGIIAIAVSFIRTREDQINDKIKQLQSLQNFTKCILKSLKLEELTRIFQNQMADIFQINEVTIALLRGNKIKISSGKSAKKRDPILSRMIRETLNHKKILFWDLSGDIHTQFQNSIHLHQISVPIEAHGNQLGVIIMGNDGKPIRLSEKDLEFLFQFLDLISISLENAHILEQLESSHAELRMIAQHIIMVQEKERKKLAGEIHDSVAQSLTSINYKIQFCKELHKANSNKLPNEFDLALKMSNEAIAQSRALISSLRPNLIDIMGLIPALKQYFNTFEQETGLKIHLHRFTKVLLASDLKMCVFRVVQESLTNINRHADAKRIDFSLYKKGEELKIFILDDGKGFNIEEKKNTCTLGLLLMKERIESFGGTISIHSELNKGCQVRVSIPFSMKDQNEED